MKQVSAIFLIITLSVATLTAKDNYVDPYKGYDESAFMDMELDQNIMTTVLC